MNKASIKNTIVKRFTEICVARNITINELAKQSGVTPSTAYSMLDSRRQNVSINTIAKFCKGLNISLKDFFDSPLFS